MKNKTLWITQTALFIALIIITQLVTKSFGQLVTGSAVNFLLVAATLSAGISSGITVAILSPFFALLLGIGLPMVWLPPLIAIGNVTIVVVSWLFANKSYDKEPLLKYSMQVMGVVVASALKFLVLWGLIVKVALKFFVKDMPPKQAVLISNAFSAPQLITALIGCALAFAVVPTIRRALVNKNL